MPTGSNGSLLLKNTVDNLREINSTGSGSHIIIQHPSYNGGVGIGTTVLDGYKFRVHGGSQFSGIVTATQFVGDGSLLTGIVASGTGITIQEEGSNVGTASTINFVGAAVTATISSGTATVNISAPPPAIWW